MSTTGFAYACVQSQRSAISRAAAQRSRTLQTLPRTTKQALIELGQVNGRALNELCQRLQGSTEL